MVSLRLCTGEDGLRDALVSKRQGELYRRARDAEWGDGWPPVLPGKPGHLGAGNQERSDSEPVEAPSLEDVDD
ncbi:small ribosomal subunit Rsm22 family protein [Nonomuraea sp. B12E4]|uniref:small ribosomal subunit Rsm22 family protein n=1 Tax=Nonomuraea sp. B12E4 TaxID=3153564 RepID=UPI00325CE005